MKNYHFKLLLGAISIAATATLMNDSCSIATAKPDLIPLEVNADSYDAYNSIYCNRRSDGGLEIRVRVRNQGNAVAPPSVTCVRFPSENVCLDTPQINAGEERILIFNLSCPPGVGGHLSCPVTIEVNAESDFTESRTSNNTAKGACNIVG